MVVLWAWSVAMTGLTLILAGAPLKSLRTGLGRVSFITVGVLTSAAFFLIKLKFLACSYLSFVLLIEAFTELEELEFPLLINMCLSTLSVSLLTTASIAVWMSRVGMQWASELHDRLVELLQPMAQLGSSLQINVDDIIAQLPSLAIIVWLAALYIAVVLEGRVRPGQSKASFYRGAVDKVEVPHAVVWIFIAALAFAFGDFGLARVQPIAINVLNVCLMLFFFQGLAVVYRVFAVFRVGYIWQALIMVIIVAQLFLLVSLLGLVDFWIDFRTRLSKRHEEMNKELQ